MKFIELDGPRGFQQAIRATDNPTKLIVIGSPDDAALLNDALSMSYSASRTLQDSAGIDAEQWLAAKRLELQASFDEAGEDGLDSLAGKWAGGSGLQQSFALDKDILTQEPLEKLAAIEVPCEGSWQVPAHLNFGGWNNCAAPAEHCALWQYWQRKYGAKIVGLSGDVIEAHVSQPPRTREDAMELAWQHFLYCPDLVEQGVESIAHLAGALLDQKVWFFWWD